MYEKFFGFTESPFNQTPDPQFFFSSLTHEDALSQVLYGITHRKGFIVIIGEVGTGKTTLCRRLLETLGPSVKTALILTPGLTTVELLLSVNQGLEIKCRGTSKKELVDELHRFLLDTLAGGGNAVLMIDEAQNLSVECLEEIRLLSNLETTKEKLLQIVLLGQPELGSTLRLTELRQLAQRVALRAHLLPLDREETRRYITSRLGAAGGGDKVLFTSDAAERVHTLSGGVPRLINALCDKALLAGFIRETTVIEEDLIEEAGREMEGMNQLRDGTRSAGPIRQRRPGDPDAIPRLSRSTVLESDQRRPWFRLIPSWVGLVGLVVAGVLGMVFWLGPTWYKGDQTVDGTKTVPPPASAPAIEVPLPKAVAPAPVLPIPDKRGAPPSPVRSPLASALSPLTATTSEPSGTKTLTVAGAQKARLAATLSLLQRWGFFPSVSVDSLIGRDPAGLIEEVGLQSTTLPVEWDTLERLDYPCLLEWKDTPRGVRHAVVLVSLSPVEVTLFDPLVGWRVVSRSEILRHVTGEALIPWKALPGIALPFRPKEGEAPSVVTLQRALKKEGLLEGTENGLYDSATREAITRLQSEVGLKETGVFGLRSHMALSKRVLGPEAPSLKARPDATLSGAPPHG